MICREEDELLYTEAVQTFLKTDQPRPVCCGIKDSDERRHARLKVVKDTSKASFGRPFFVCPKEKNPCHYFEWGDKIIEEKPLCKHGTPCIVRKVKKAGKNKGRFFLCCGEGREDDCKFFEWSNRSNPTRQQPLPPLKAYAEFTNKNKPPTLPKRSIDDPTSDDNNDYETQPKNEKKRKTKPKKLQLDVRDKPNNVTGWWKGFIRPRNDVKERIVKERINNAINGIRPPAQCPVPQASEEGDPKQQLEKQMVKSFFENFKMTDDCKKGNCGHFECFDLAHKDGKECNEELEDYSEGSQS